MIPYADRYRLVLDNSESPNVNCYTASCFTPLPKEQPPPPPPNSSFPICYSYNEYMKEQQHKYLLSQGMVPIPCDEAVKDYNKSEGMTGISCTTGQPL